MKLLLLVALLGVAYVAAECPEACNGHGFCGEYDKCPSPKFFSVRRK